MLAWSAWSSSMRRRSSKFRSSASPMRDSLRAFGVQSDGSVYIGLKRRRVDPNARADLDRKDSSASRPLVDRRWAAMNHLSRALDVEPPIRRSRRQKRAKVGDLSLEPRNLGVSRIVEHVMLCGSAHAHIVRESATSGSSTLCGVRCHRRRVGQEEEGEVNQRAVRSLWFRVPRSPATGNRLATKS
jgi:hypothetical protein